MSCVTGEPLSTVIEYKNVRTGEHVEITSLPGDMSPWDMLTRYVLLSEQDGANWEQEWTRVEG